MQLIEIIAILKKPCTTRKTQLCIVLHVFAIGKHGVTYADLPRVEFKNGIASFMVNMFVFSYIADAVLSQKTCRWCAHVGAQEF